MRGQLIRVFEVRKREPNWKLVAWVMFAAWAASTLSIPVAYDAGKRVGAAVLSDIVNGQITMACGWASPSRTIAQR